MIRAKLKKEIITNTGKLQLDVEFEIAQGNFITFFGDSGAGKTTLLRLLAGLSIPDEGFLQIEDEVWFDSSKKINLPAQKRSIGFVFQNYPLFPNMTVRQNMEFALGGNTEPSMVNELLQIFEMEKLQFQKPHQLSGGQQQRVALMRALLRRPKVLLLDEPFSALDISMRLKLQDEILRFYKNWQATAIFVSHEISEVFKVSNKVFVLQSGKIIKSGIPFEVFTQSNLSGKFRFAGHICEIKKEPPVNILTILIGNNLTKVVASDDEISDLRVGDKVIVASKAFNPVVLKFQG